MRVESLHPGVDFERVQDNTGFELLKAAKIRQTEPPREKELSILRREVDPYRYIIGR
jgi:glutaconate CoA-transferase subunit B